jgi:hypothetical protein
MEALLVGLMLVLWGAYQIGLSLVVGLGKQVL